MNPSNEDLRLLVKVSRFYYEDGLNQDAIKDRLGLSRSKVSRLMAQAREQGVVQISVVSPAQLYLDLESRLEERFGLQEALVVESQPGDPQDAVSRAVGHGAAGFLVRALQPLSTVGFAWGSTFDPFVSYTFDKDLGLGAGRYIVRVGAISSTIKRSTASG